MCWKVCKINNTHKKITTEEVVGMKGVGIAGATNTMVGAGLAANAGA